MLENTGIFSASVGQDPANRCAYRDTNVYKKKKKCSLPRVWTQVIFIDLNFLVIMASGPGLHGSRSLIL